MPPGRKRADEPPVKKRATAAAKLPAKKRATAAAEPPVGRAPSKRAARGYHHGDLKRALVDAGLALLEESGVDAVRVREAARRVGVSPAAPFRHFPSREDFLREVA